MTLCPAEGIGFIFGSVACPHYIPVFKLQTELKNLQNVERNLKHESG